MVQTCLKVGYGVSREPDFFTENDTLEKREKEAEGVASQLQATYTAIRVLFLLPCSFPLLIMLDRTIFATQC